MIADVMFIYIFFFKLLSLSFIITAAAQNSNHVYLGCYLEDNLLSLGEESRVLTPISPRACSQFCSEKQYLFFNLKHNTCYCNRNFISRLMKQFDHECTIKCSGDESNSCGGSPNFVSSYIADNSKSVNYGRSYPIPIYLGCYSETPNDAENRLLKGPAQPYNNNTPQRCSEICIKMGYLYFGVTYGSECWCGNQKPSKSLKVEDMNCDSLCSGDNKQYCGGGWKMGIYSTGITDYVPKKYVGCFEDGEHKTKGKHISFQLDTNNSPKRCMNLCNTLRYKYAAIKGNVCECQSNEPNQSLKRSYNDCSTSCPANPSERCGGKTSSSVYKTVYSDPQGKVAVNHIGCFKNLQRHPTMHGWGVTNSRLTPKYCVYSCYARRFPYAALVSSKECLCSFIKPSNEAKIEDNKCTVPCSGSSQHSCGGYNAINVYTTGLKWNTDITGNYYLGCFEENQNNRIFSSYSRSFTINTPEFCSTLCYKFGYTYSGVTYKSECFCGNQSPNESQFPRKEDKQCNTKCSGDANQFCGGGWRMGVFATGLYDFPVDDRYLGCFILQDDALNYIKYELISTNTPSKCSAICNNAGFKYSGIMGINCLCTNHAPENSQKVADSDCDATCIGDSSQTCGGEDRIQIYHLSTLMINSQLSNNPDLISLQEEFNSFNLDSLWSHDIYIAQDPDFEFVVYNNSESNSYVKNGELVIKPTILPDDFVERGHLKLKGCTKKSEESAECSKNAFSYNIIPPIVSARLTTKHFFLVLYGQLEVIAKLPEGDWIVSEIALINKDNEKNKFILASLFGNTNLNCNGSDESTAVLKYGLKTDEQYDTKPKIMKSTLTDRWSSDYHTFALISSPESVIFKIDGESNYLDASTLPSDLFNSDYYISIAVSVGGMTNFHDDCVSNGHLKPWKNCEVKAILKFWKDRHHWNPTWNEENSALRVKKITFTASNNVE